MQITKKHCIIGVLTALEVFILYKAFRRFFGGSQSDKDYIEEIKEEAKVTKKTRLLTDKDVASIVSSLYKDLVENASEDDDDALEQILKITTKADWLAVVASFGVRQDNSYFKSFSGTLPQAIISYLDKEQLIQAEKHLNSIGVTL